MVLYPQPTRPGFKLHSNYQRALLQISVLIRDLGQQDTPFYHHFLATHESNLSIDEALIILLRNYSLSSLELSPPLLPKYRCCICFQGFVRYQVDRIFSLTNLNVRNQVSWFLINQLMEMTQDTREFLA